MRETPPGDVAALLRAALEDALPDRVGAVLAHGSWVHGDFAPGRSDLDLLVVTRTEPDEALLAGAGRAVGSVVERHHEWVDRIEIGFVTADGIRAVLAGEPAGNGARISPGEPLHLVPLERHQVLDWDAARRGRALAGSTDVVPPIPHGVLQEVVREHLVYWASTVAGLDSSGPEADVFRAYVVLTVCRARALLDAGRQVSKRAAAAWAGDALSHHGPLVRWAAQCWYDASSAPPPASIEAFVREVASG